MAREDLELCWLPHATSKIESLEDLEKITTLGFRGEALSSMAACSRLEIISSEEEEAFRLTVHGGKMLELISHSGSPGTGVTVQDLFYNMPARRRFLKSARGESTLCRRIFLEKAAAHPETGFRMFMDGVLKSYLPPGSYQNRVSTTWPRLAPPAAWWETEAEGDGFVIRAVHARPEISRKDRQYIQIYANRRRIDEFALIQAVQYAYDSWMPGGAFPVAFIFIDINPSLVDFNIHPAKKEARFRDLPAIRHRLVDMLKDRLTGESYRKRAESSGLTAVQSVFSDEAASDEPRGFSHSSQENRRPTEQEAERFSRIAASGKPATGKPGRFSPTPVEKGGDFRYLGQVMGVFLLAETPEALFIIDQHAAHERILYDKLRNAEKKSERLLIPRILEPEKAAGMKLELRKERLSTLGLEIERNENNEWTLTAVPEAASGLEESLVTFLEEGAGDAEGLDKALWADLACKAAIRDNTPLDDAAAVRLIRETFNLEIPRCPHGRPLWFEISRRELFELLGRTV
jgi:DNA mismatch repair protein MutL